MSLLVGQCLQNLRLMKKKISLIIAEEKTIIIINYEKKEMIPLTYEANKSYKEQEACHICEEKFCMGKDDEK